MFALEEEVECDSIDLNSKKLIIGVKYLITLGLEMHD